MSTPMKRLIENRAAKAKDLQLYAENPDGFNAETFAEKEKEVLNLDSQIDAAKKAMQFNANKMPDEQEQKELRKFSIVDAISDLQKGRVSGHAAELTQEGANELKSLGIADSSSIILPTSYLKTKFRNELSKGGDPSSAELIQKTVSASLIDVLYSNLVFADVATFFAGLNGKLSFPRFTRSSTAVAVKAEGANAGDVSPTVDEITLDAQRIPVEVPITDTLLVQSSVDVEMWVRNHLAALLAEHIEKMAIADVLGTSGIGAVAMGGNGGPLTWAKVVELETKVKNKRAGRGALAYLTNANVVGSAKTTPKVSGQPIYLMRDDSAIMNGRGVRETEEVPSNLTKGTATGVCSAMIFGNWNDLYIGQWGGVGLQLNPYRESKAGKIIVEAKIFADTAVARPDSFAAIQDITTT